MERIGTFNGMPIRSNSALTRLEPLFPDKPRTKRRMRRVIGRHGAWAVPRPYAVETPLGIIAHPTIIARMKQLAREGES